MTASLHRLIVVLFVLLQGLAPLLHGHPASGGQAGLHLPGWTDLAAGPPPAPGWQGAGHSGPGAVIGVASSLEARQHGLVAGGEGLAGHGGLSPGCPGAAAVVGRGGGRVSTPPVPHLLPFACAPPLA